MSVLRISIGPFEISEPYRFHETGIKVFSFEELMFHAYHYWRASIDDFISGRLEEWVFSILKLEQIACRMCEINKTERSVSEKYINFLRIENLFTETELEELSNEIVNWEKDLIFKQEKAAGDEALLKEDYQKAINHYNEASTHVLNHTVYNNLGIALTRLRRFREAEGIFLKALNIDPENKNICLNLTALYIGMGRYEKAGQVLSGLKSADTAGKAELYKAKILEAESETKSAELYYKQAVSKAKDKEAYKELANFYINNNRLKEAKELTFIFKETDKRNYLLLSAKICETANMHEDALRYTLKLLSIWSKDCDAWILLARLYRKNGEFEKATSAIQNAIAIDKYNKEALNELKKLTASGKPVEESSKNAKKFISKWKSEYRKLFTD